MRFLLETRSSYHTSELLARIAAGDSDAFTVFYRQHVPLLRAYAMKWLRADVDVEEILQAAFIRVWLSRDKLPEIANMQAWLYTITARLCLQHFRNEKRREKKLENAPKEGHELETPFHLVQLKLLKQLIQSAIDAMPEKRRKVVYLNRNGGAGPTEISKKLSMPVGTVKNHLSEANREIRAFLRARGYTDLLPVLLLLQIF